MLDGVRVIDLSTDVAGAFATRLLGVYGADVVLVEPPGGHPVRSIPPRAGGIDGGPDASILGAYLHAGKRSIVLDLDTPEDRATLPASLDRSRTTFVYGDCHAVLSIQTSSPNRTRWTFDSYNFV